MTHLNEEQLILHYYGEETTADTELNVDRHLAQCSECRAEYNTLRLVLNTVDSAPVPERGGDYGTEVWRRIQPRFGRRRWFAIPKWWILSPALAGLLIAAFLAGRISRSPEVATVRNASQVRERILMVAVGDHLDRSQMVLAELSNAPDGKGSIDISAERQMAGDLIEDNRLYRQTAQRSGDSAVASVLDDLERVLIEIANSPSQVSTGQFEQLRTEIRDHGLMFKVRVVESQVRRREAPPQAANGSKTEAKKL